MTTTPLHDGAVIIQGDKLSCAAYFPPTTMDLPAKYGARHRAAIGISEVRMLLQLSYLKKQEKCQLLNKAN